MFFKETIETCENQQGVATQVKVHDFSSFQVFVHHWSGFFDSLIHDDPHIFPDTQLPVPVVSHSIKFPIASIKKTLTKP